MSSTSFIASHPERKWHAAQPGTAAPGVGLGLYLAQHIVGQLNGEITVESKQGEGTTFSVLFRDGLKMVPPKKVRRTPMSKRLLVVDDEPNLLRAVAACLKAEDYEVSTARSGHEALMQLAEAVPDLIISDIRMPGMDGYKLARQLRGSPRTALVPIVFLTAKDETADRIEGFRAGIDAYLTKPFEPDELIAVVNGILNRVERTHSQIARLVSSAMLTKPLEFSGRSANRC